MDILVSRKQEKRAIFKGISLKNRKEKIISTVGSLSNTKTALADSTRFYNSYYSFNIPTRSSQNSAVFSLQFEVKDKLLTRKFQVVLNPVMDDEVENRMKLKQFELNGNGFYKFENEVFAQYYLRGSIQLTLDKSIDNEINGNINISYGKINEGLNFIIGTVSLLKQEDEVRFKNMLQNDSNLYNKPATE